MAVYFEKNALVIKMHHNTPPTYTDLFYLQSNLIRLMQFYDHSNQTDGMELWHGLNLLHETLVEPQEVKNLVE
jgi:hypothetical protein